MLLEKIADDFFGVAGGVGVGGIEEVPALLEVIGQNFFGVGHAGSEAAAEVFAEGHGTEAKRTDAQSGAAEGNV